MRKMVTLTVTFLMLMGMVTGIVTGNNSQTVVSYTRQTGDVFPERDRIDVSVTAVGSVKFTRSDGTVLPSGSTGYSIAASPESGTLTVNYDIDTLLVKRSGSRSETFDPEWLLVEKAVTVYYDPPVRINVTMHGHLKGHVTTVGNGSATPSDVTWTTWGNKSITVSANADAENGQTIEIETATEYVVYFTVTAEVGPVEVFEKDSPTKGASGSHTIQSSIDVVPEFPNWIAWTAVIVVVSLVVLFGSKKLRSSYEKVSNRKEMKKMKRKILFGIVIILTAIAISAVVAYQTYTNSSLLPVGIPKVVDIRLSWGEVTYEITKINVELVIHNPNPIRVRVKIEEPELYVNDIKFAWTEKTVEVNLPRKSNSTVSFVLVVDNNNIQEVWGSHIQQAEVSTFRLEAKLTALKLPISAERTISTNILEQVEEKLKDETS